MWTFIMFALVGLIAGWLARLVVPGVRSGGALVDCLTGMVGAVIGWAVCLIFPILGIFGAIPPAFVGAVILLYLLKASAARPVR